MSFISIQKLLKGFLSALKVAYKALAKQKSISFKHTKALHCLKFSLGWTWSVLCTKLLLGSFHCTWSWPNCDSC